MENNQPVTPAAASLPQQPVSPVPIDPIPPKKSKKLIFIIIGVLLIVILLVLGGYLFRQSGGKLPSQIAPTPSPVPTVSQPSPTIVITTSQSPRNEIRVLLKKDLETNIPNTNIVAKFEDNIEPEQGCFDCGNTYKIRITQDKTSKILSLVCGGIAGTCSEEKYIGYIFVIGNVPSNNEVELVIK